MQFSQEKNVLVLNKENKLKVNDTKIHSRSSFVCLLTCFLFVLDTQGGEENSSDNIWGYDGDEDGGCGCHNRL